MDICKIIAETVCLKLADPRQLLQHWLQCSHIFRFFKINTHISNPHNRFFLNQFCNTLSFFSFKLLSSCPNL